MLIRSEFLERIADGSVRLAFRRWRRPTVRSGGSLMTPIGQLEITSVCIVSEDSITRRDAAEAGYTSLEELLRELNRRSEGEVYRIEMGRIGMDPRRELRGSIPDSAETEVILQRLARLDHRSPAGPWTGKVLGLLAEQPGVSAEHLSRHIGLDKPAFKTNVRKLKSLGLTISLEKGYRLSPRGKSVLAAYRGSVAQGDAP